MYYFISLFSCRVYIYNELYIIFKECDFFHVGVPISIAAFSIVEALILLRFAAKCVTVSGKWYISVERKTHHYSLAKPGDYTKCCDHDNMLHMYIHMCVRGCVCVRARVCVRERNRM